MSDRMDEDFELSKALQQSFDEEEKRIAKDGVAYTCKEFISHYGSQHGAAVWHKRPRSECDAATEAGFGPPLKYLSGPNRSASSTSSAGNYTRVRLLHVSDTHGYHDQIAKWFPLQDADILLHTGDLT